MKIFPRKLPASLASSLTEHLGSRPAVLAWGETPDGGAVVGLTDRFCVWADGEWRSVGWHDVVRGGWNDEAGSLHWTARDGVSHEVALSDPGRMPELFRERVEASILLARTVELGGGRRIIVSARRDLADAHAPALWLVTPGPRTDMADPEVVAIAQAKIAELQGEYGL